MPIAEAFERDGEEAFRAREAEVVGELLERRRRRRDRARRRQRPLRAGSRGARPPHRRLAAGRRRRGLAADRGHRPAAGAQRRGRRGPARACGCRSTRSSPTRSCRRAIRGLVARALPSIRALAELPAGTQAALGRAAPRASTRSWSGRACWTPVCWPLEGTALLRHRHRRRAPSTPTRVEPLAGADRGRAGGGGEDDGRGGAGAARAGPRRDDPRGPRRRARRRRRRRPGRLLRPHLPARRPGRPGPDLAGRPGRLRLRRQDRRRPARGQELRRRLPPAGGGDRRHLDPRPASPPRSWRRASSRC